MARVWITRTQPAADESAARLTALGYDCVTAPLLELTDLPVLSAPSVNDYLIFTSRNGVAAFARAHKDRLWPCICVGDSTARTARAAGFTRVNSAKGNADDLVIWVQQNISPDIRLYHVSGSHPRGDIIQRLKSYGFSKPHREAYYKSHIVTIDPRAAPRPDDIILLYSPMAAKGLGALDLDMRDMIIISLSRAVDAALGDKICKARYIAAHPSEDSLFAHLP